LSDAQVAYAASDVLYLHDLMAKLDVMLAREGRAELAQRRIHGHLQLMVVQAQGDGIDAPAHRPPDRGQGRILRGVEIGDGTVEEDRIEPAQGQEVDEAALKASLKGRVADWWIPDRIVAVPAMPLAGTGKIDKTQLRARYGGA